MEDGSQLCEKCASTDPPELAATSMVLHFLALTSGPSLTFLCFTLSEEFFVQVPAAVATHTLHISGAA